MKKLLILGILGFVNVGFAANRENIEILLSHKDQETILELNKSTVRCLVGDYGASSLKISVPQLRFLTVFRHTTRGEVQPCINAGPCFADRPSKKVRSPEDVIDDSRPTEIVSISVDLFENLYIDHEKKSCVRTLVEKVFSKVRGMDFKHVDSGSLGQTSYDACLKLKEAAAK
ncbi:MAG: hypothetical protein A4S09_00625 [Proteobacteria bacterium SG_bin7]|nr:MAG: hypothetical protein A4S09_00625 [Proteobacteria bacterium SG_bin7]